MNFLEKFGINVAWVLVGAGLLSAFFAFNALNIESNVVLRFMVSTSPFWLPVLTFLIFFEYWIYYVRKKFDLEQGRVTLEIKLPQDVFKSPEAMELVLNQMYQTASPDNHIQTYWDGKHTPKYGLELVSRGGDVRFYINVPRKKFKNIVETQLYAQYPGIEVHELDIDYTAEIPWDPERFAYFSIHFGLKKADAYPIKTYIDYGLDKMPDEEEKIDPITSMLEALGSIGPGEYLWVQILIDANKELAFKDGSLKLKHDWKDEARAEISNIILTANKRMGIDPKKDSTKPLTYMNLTDTEKDTIKAIERSLGKNAFNVCIRGMYIGTLDAFIPSERIGALITGWRSYDDLNRNAIVPLWRTDFDWNWWQDPTGKKRESFKQRELNEYKRRHYNSHNKKDGAKVMTTEELATIFHIPGKVAATPTLARIPSKRAEPPANLPIG